jgi:hypothetical protein
MNTTSDDAQYGSNVRTPAAGVADYNLWLSHLDGQQLAMWSRITHGLDNAARLQLFQGMYVLPKTRISLNEALVIVRPTVNYKQWRTSDTFICLCWQNQARAKLLFSPEAGFCALMQVIR